VTSHKRGQKAVHRPLHLVTPLTDGLDVEALQSAIKHGFDVHKVDWLPLKVDGELGPQTIHAARFYTWIIGLGAAHRTTIQQHQTIQEATQKLIRSLASRSAADRRRAKRRQRHLVKIRKAQTEGPKAAVAYAREWIGTTEDPAGSNTGPTSTKNGRRGGVSFWQEHWGLNGAYWCLSFASYCAAVIGGAKISGNVAYSVAIEGYARNHENGFVQVPVPEAKAGDFTIWKFDGPDAASDHGELVAVVSGGPKEDIGGNTSSEGGSQSNGGGVFAKTVGSDVRPLSELSMVVRPLYS
jgi:hypothetical protein